MGYWTAGTVKVCSKCEIEKPLACFRTLRNNTPPWRTSQSECRSCRDISIAPVWVALRAWSVGLYASYFWYSRMEATLEALAPQWGRFAAGTTRPDEPTRRRCLACGRRKPLDDFGIRRDNLSTGRAARCLACERERDRDRYAETGALMYTRRLLRQAAATREVMGWT